MLPRNSKGVLPCLVAIVFLTAARSWAADAQVLEGFEKFTSTSKAVTGKFAVIDGKSGITEGRQALLLEPGSRVAIPVKNIDASKLPWLRVDTFCEQKTGPARLHFSFDFPKESNSCHVAICQDGQDTVALPLTLPCHYLSKDWPEEEVTVRLTNLGTSPLTLDNIRLEAAETPPPNTTLIDVGDERQALWPGFSAARNEITWSGKNETYAYGGVFPDPLTGDFLSPYLQEKVEDRITIDSDGQGVAWLWVTHYGRGNIQPPEYYMRAKGKVLLAKRSSIPQLLGKEGLQEGIDGEWTPQWMEKTHLPRLVELVQVQLSPGKNVIETCNVQIAAAVIAPVSSRTAAAAYVEKVKRDLARFHRQFVLGQKVEIRCEVEPSESETKSGVMFFSPPRGSSVRLDYVPVAESRTKLAEGSLYNGGLCVIPLAAVPLKKGVFSGSVSPLKSVDGKPLGPAPELYLLDRVPSVASGQAFNVPWILAKRISVRPRDVAHLAVVVQGGANAAGGDYSGTIRLNTGTSVVELPIVVRLHNLGSDAVATPTFGVYGCDAALLLYGPIIAPLDNKKKTQLDVKLRQDVMSLGFNAIALPSVGITTDAKDAPVVYDDPLVDALRGLTAKNLKGRMQIDLSASLYRLDRMKIHAGGSRFEELMKDVASRSESLLSRAGISDSIRSSSVTSMEELEKAHALNAGLSACGPLASSMSDVVILQASKAQFLKALKPVQTLLVQVNGWRAFMGKVDAFMKEDEKRELFIVLNRPDEFGFGFYSFAAGARGWYCASPFQSRPYRGFDFGFDGLLAPDLDMNQPCLQLQSVLWMRQGMSDFALGQRAQALVDKAKKAGVDASALDKLLGDLRKKVRESTPVNGAGTDELQKTRQSILEASAKLAEQMKK